MCPKGSQSVTQAVPGPLALLKIEASPETFGRTPMTLSSEFRENFSVRNIWSQG